MAPKLLFVSQVPKLSFSDVLSYKFYIKVDTIKLKVLE